jgi:hypothetical protein
VRSITRAHRIAFPLNRTDHDELACSARSSEAPTSAFAFVLVLGVSADSGIEDWQSEIRAALGGKSEELERLAWRCMPAASPCATLRWRSQGQTSDLYRDIRQGCGGAIQWRIP